MTLLIPHPNQVRPTSAAARSMCQQITLQIRPLTDPRIDSVLNRIRQSHANGGALFASFTLGPSDVFDWFASRGRLLEFGVLRLLLDRAEVSRALPDLQIAPSSPEDPAFAVRKMDELMDMQELSEMMKSDLVGDELRRHGAGANYDVSDAEYDGNLRVMSTFLFDGELTQKLYYGGAYTSPQGDGRNEKESALAFCEALFGLRLSELDYWSSRYPWTPWFANIGMDWTAIFFDRRTRVLSILAMTDTD